MVILSLNRVYLRYFIVDGYTVHLETGRVLWLKFSSFMGKLFVWCMIQIDQLPSQYIELRYSTHFLIAMRDLSQKDKQVSKSCCNIDLNLQ